MFFWELFSGDWGWRRVCKSDFRELKITSEINIPHPGFRAFDFLANLGI
jgi:hypothetical protein